MLVSEIKTVKQLIKSVLENYPSTRNSDTLLYIQCCRELGATSLDDLEKLNLSIVSIHKVRQVIQNKEGLFVPNSDVKKERQKRCKGVYEQVKLI